MKVCLDEVKYTTKPDKKEAGVITLRLPNSIRNMEVQEIAEGLTKGRTLVPAWFTDGKKSNATWAGQTLYGLDFDDGITVEEVLERCKKYDLEPVFIYSTFSSVNNNKFRVFFCNETEVTDYRVRGVIQLALMKIFKESDNSCKDGSRMYYGGRALLYANYEARINVVDLVREMCRYINDSDSVHASREIQSYCQSVGVDMFNGLPKVLARSEGDIIDIEAISKIGEIPCTPILYISIGQHGISPKTEYGIYFNTSNNITSGSDKKRAKFTVVNEKLEREITEHFSFDDLEENCRLYKEFANGEYTHHHEREGIAMNLLMVKGGRKKFFEALEGGDYDNKAWEYYCNYFVKMNYFPMRCDNFCPYAETCEHTRNMIEQIKLPKGQVRIINNPEVKTLEQAETELKEAFEKAMAAKDNKVYVIKAPTGIGKTRLYLDLKKVTIALPTHKLKEEVAGLMKVKFTSTPKLPDDERLKFLYSIGSYMVANQYIQKMAKEGNQEFIEYMEQEKDAKLYSGTILTTHDKMLSLRNSNNTIIIDEDIISTLLPLNTTALKDLETMAEQCGYFDTRETIESLKNFAKIAGNGLVYEMPSYGGIKTSKLEALVNDNKINSNVLGFLNCGHFVKYTTKTGEVVINFINKRQLPEKKKIIMLSATANEYICKLMFGDRLVFIDIGYVETKGDILQYPQRSFSRSQMNDDEKLKLYAKALTKGKPVITYKDHKGDYDNCIATFGATAGLDAFGGQDIAVIGTPHISPVLYLLFSNALGKKPRGNVLRLYILGRNLLNITGRKTGLISLTGTGKPCPDNNTLRFKFAFNNHSHEVIVNQLLLFASSRHQAGSGNLIDFAGYSPGIFMEYA